MEVFCVRNQSGVVPLGEVIGNEGATDEMELRGIVHILAKHAKTLECGTCVTGGEEDAVVVFIVGQGTEMEGLGGDVVLGQCRASKECAGDDGCDLHLASSEQSDVAVESWRSIPFADKRFSSSSRTLYHLLPQKLGAACHRCRYQPSPALSTPTKSCDVPSWGM